VPVDAAAKAPFVEVNCAAIPEELIESELFGHRKRGLHRGAGAARGKFELADAARTLSWTRSGDMSLKTPGQGPRASRSRRSSGSGGKDTLRWTCG